MNAEHYHRVLLEGARKRHSELIREARPFTGFMREAIKRERQEWREFAHRNANRLREVRNGH